MNNDLKSGVVVENSVRRVVMKAGLPAFELRVELIRAERTSGIGHRLLAFYLHEMQSRGLHQRLGHVSAVCFAVKVLGHTRRQARDFIAVGAALRELPKIDAAFADARISWTKARLLTKIAVPETEDAWLGEALALSTRDLEQRIAGSEKGRPPKKDGMGLPRVRFRVAVDFNAAVHESLERARARLADQRGEAVSEAETLEILLHRFHAGELASATESPYHLELHRCEECQKSEVLTEDGAEPLHASDADQLCCNAETATDGPTPPVLRRRILARDGYRCVVCRGTSDLEVHHIVFRSQGGPTNSSNLTCVCNRCHALVHEGFLNIEGSGPAKLKITDQRQRRLDDASTEILPPELMEVAPAMKPENSNEESRPAPKLDAIVGQADVVSVLRDSITAAKIRGEVLDHVLFEGPAGLGKTSLARAVAAELGAPITMTTGGLISTPAAMIEILEARRPGDVVFIDEIHGLRPRVAEVLYEAMETKTLLGRPNSPISVLCATTEPELIPAPLRSRFGLVFQLDPYSDSDLAHLIQQSASAERTAIESEAIEILAHAAGGIPREALRLYRRLRSFGVARARPHLTADDARSLLRQLGLDERGLDHREQQILDVLSSTSGPISLNSISAQLHINPAALHQVYERKLIAKGRLKVTREGRVLV